MRCKTLTALSYYRIETNSTPGGAIAPCAHNFGPEVFLLGQVREAKIANLPDQPPTKRSAGRASHRRRWLSGAEDGRSRSPHRHAKNRYCRPLRQSGIRRATQAIGRRPQHRLDQGAAPMRIQQLVAGGITIDRCGRDRYRRTLAVVRVHGGQNDADIMIRERLVGAYEGHLCWPCAQHDPAGAWSGGSYSGWVGAKEHDAAAHR